MRQFPFFILAAVSHTTASHDFVKFAVSSVAKTFPLRLVLDLRLQLLAFQLQLSLVLHSELLLLRSDLCLDVLNADDLFD